MRARFLSLLLLAAAPPVLAEGTGFQVIVHPSNAAQTISHRQLNDLFLKKVTHWPSGETVVPVEPPENSRTRAYFLSDVMNGRSAFALRTYWQRRVFSGRETPPLEKPSDDEVVAFVKGNPGAVGYVTPGTVLNGVKVLEVKD